MGRKRYSEEFKREAVRLVVEGQTVEQVAIDLGVGKTTLWRWREIYAKDGMKAGAVPQTDEQLRKENARLRKRLRVLEEEKEILKKAATFFAKENT